MPLKILYVITSTTRGGAEHTLLKLATGLDRKICEPVCVVSLKKSGPVADDIAKLGIPVKTLSMGQIPSPKHAAQLTEIIKKYKPDIVHAFLYRAIQFARFALKGENIKFISSPRVNYRTRPYTLRMIDRLSRTENELVICESDATRDFLIRSMDYNPKQAITIRNGVDTKLWKFSAKLRAEKRAQLGLVKDELFIVSAGRLDAQKGHSYLVEAFALADRDGVKAKLAIVGDGPLKSSLQKLASKNGMETSVLLPGEQPDILPWLCAADIFVLPSLWEGTPNALLEAMSVGLPCVASDVDGVGEVARNVVDAMLVPPRDAQALARAICRLAGSGKLRKELGGTARARAESAFSIDKMFRAYEQAYAQFHKTPQ
jgi:glycosyltransferase involved in cell wall biosynthesis